MRDDHRGRRKQRRLRLRGPQAACDGVAARAIVLLGGATELRAAFSPRAFPVETLAGLELVGRDAANSVTLIFVRTSVAGPGSDGIGVVLNHREHGLLAREVIAPNAATLLNSGQRVELEIQLVAQPDPTLLLPQARYRLCPDAGCAPGVAFTEIPPVPGLWPGAGGLAAKDPLGLYFFGQGFSNFTVDLRSWSVNNTFHDDFSHPGFGQTLPYVRECADFENRGGRLAVTVTAADCKEGYLGSGTMLPGTHDASARFAFEMPPRCSPGVGLGLVTDAAVFQPEGVAVIVGRAPVPGVGEDVLFATLERPRDEDNSAAVAMHVIAPDAGTVSVPADAELELRISTSARLDGLLETTGELRLCDTTPCLHDVPFQTLAPYAFPPGYVSPCSAFADQPLPHPDGAALPPLPYAAFLYFAPEPGAGGAAVAALATLGTLAQRRRADHEILSSDGGSAPSVGCRRSTRRVRDVRTNPSRSVR